MNKFIKLGLSAIAIVLFINSFAVTDAKAQHINEILKRMEEHRSSLTSLQSDVQMVKYNSQLDEVEENLKGTTMYLPETKDHGMYVRINWTNPTEQLAVIENEYVLYRPRLNQAIIGKVDKAKNSASSSSALSFMSMSKAELKDNYSIKYIGQEGVGGVDTWHLELTPTTKNKYKTADLWVDGNGMPVRVVIIEKNNDKTTVTLSNIKKNVKIDPKVFAIKLPKTVERVKG